MGLQFAGVLFVFTCPCSLRLPNLLNSKVENEALRSPAFSFWRKCTGRDTDSFRGRKVSRRYSTFFDSSDAWFLARFVRSRIIRRYSLIKRAIAVSLLSSLNAPEKFRTIALQSRFCVHSVFLSRLMCVLGFISTCLQRTIKPKVPLFLHRRGH